MTNEIKNTKVEELEVELELLWTLLVEGIIDLNERNQISTALQNEIAAAKKA